MEIGMITEDYLIMRKPEIPIYRRNYLNQKTGICTLKNKNFMKSCDCCTFVCNFLGISGYR